MNKVRTQWCSGVPLKVALLLFCLLVVGVGSSHAAPASDTKSVLILGSTVQGAASSVEAAEAAQAGFTVVVASDDDWGAMTTADFSSYRAIVFADGMCLGSGSLKAAVANQNVWGPAVTGNVIVVGTHPSSIALVTPNAHNFIQNALRFAGAAQSTGAYINLGCFMSSSKPTDISVLKPFGDFSVVRQNGCSAGAHLIASDPSLNALNDNNMSLWKCTPNAEFVKWPDGFVPFAVATDVGGQFVDPSTGANVSPYVLVRGAQVTPLTTLQGGTSSPAAAQMSAAGDFSSQMSVDGGFSPLSLPGDPIVNVSFPMSANHDFFNDTVNLTDSGWGFIGTLRAFLNWGPQSGDTLQYDSTHLRQGQSPGMVDTLDPGHGNMCLGIEANLQADLDSNTVDLGGVSQSICGDCPLGIDGSPYACTLDKADIELFCGGVGLVDACIAMTLSLDSNVTPDSFSTDRTVYYDGAPGTGPDVLAFPPNPLPDPFKVSCVQPQGTDAVYELANPRSNPHIGFSVNLGVAGQICELCVGNSCVNCNDVIDKNLLTIGPFADVPLNLTGPTRQTDLGLVQQDNIAPDLTGVLASYSGNEGEPGIAFTAAGAKDDCIDYSEIVWNYSDHGVAYGMNPTHVFQDGGAYTGELVVTDLAGNKSTKAFTVSVTSLPPIVSAGPDTTSLWGVPVAFNGSATAPGADDQATLVYTWTFGDGTPSATGGPSVLHAYSAPGTYTATLKVCDEDALCSSDSRDVVVNKRNVTIGYLGDQQGIYNTLTNLSASLVDERGAIVPGRTVVFTIGAEAGGSAATNSSGIGSTTHLLGLDAGSYTATATFAGDSLYNAAAPSNTAYTVNKKPTSVAYTGSLTGGPNKSINLTAVLVDSQNNPLAGRVISFLLGSQSATATTNASGIAATTLKLNQKNGSYTLTSTFTPAGGDANHYLGSVASATFKLQAK